MVFLRRAMRTLDEDPTYLAWPIHDRITDRDYVIMTAEQFRKVTNLANIQTTMSQNGTEGK